jgi:hypothetical protein
LDTCTLNTSIFHAAKEFLCARTISRRVTLFGVIVVEAPYHACEYRIIAELAPSTTLVIEATPILMFWQTLLLAIDEPFGAAKVGRITYLKACGNAALVRSAVAACTH